MALAVSSFNLQYSSIDSPEDAYDEEWDHSSFSSSPGNTDSRSDSFLSSKSEIDLLEFNSEMYIYSDSESEMEYVDAHYDDLYYDPYDQYEELESTILYNKRARSNRRAFVTSCLRRKRHNRHKKFKNKYVKVVDQKKEERYRNNVAPIEKNVPISQLFNEDDYLRDLNLAIEQSMASVSCLESNVSSRIMNLQNREITPEDYDLLLLLDESIPKKTLKSTVRSKFTKTEVSESLVGDVCGVCMDQFVIAEKITKLSCNHIFHTPCIDQWLSSYSTKCPIDGLSLS